MSEPVRVLIAESSDADSKVALRKRQRSGATRHVSSFAAAAAVAMAALVLAGWAFDVAALKSIVPGSLSVKPNTALAFLLTGLALLVSSGSHTALVSRLAQLCAALAGLIGLLTLGEYASGWNPGIDQWLFREPPGAAGTSHPGRMAPDTALCFVLLAAGIVIVRGSRRPRLALVASALSGSLVTTVALVTILSSFTPGLGPRGFRGLTIMAVPTAACFALLGAAIALEAWRRALGSGLERFSSRLWTLAGCVGALAAAFALYARSQNEIARANASRYRCYLLADELRQSGDDLTRMARTYVVTGDIVYKQRFQDILDIRDGRKTRPEDYARPYWDLMLGDGRAPRGNDQSVPLLELMRQAGFTAEEFAKLAEAKANSDGLTIPEIEAMRLVDSAGPDAEANRARARLMMYEEKYHQAKAAVMGPIHDLFVLLDRRTQTAVETANRGATILAYLVGALGLGLTLALWRTYVALGSTLGGSVDEVHAHISRIGRGELSTTIPVKAGLEGSVLGRLAETQAKLNDIDRERRQSEEALRASEERFRRAVMDSPFPILLHAEDGAILQASNSWCEITGYTPEELRTIADWTERAYGERKERVQADIEALYGMDRRKAEGDYTIRTKPGDTRIWEFSSAPLGRLPDGRRIVVSMAMDVTDRRAAENEVRKLNAELDRRVTERTSQLEAANKELEAFSYSVSHDLRAPLRAIDGYGRILMEDHQDRLDPEGRRVLGVISSETRCMGQLVDDLLAFSRLGRQRLNSSVIDMTALAKAVFEEQAALDRRRALQLELTPLPPAHGDRAMIRVVMVNLLSNAIKFTAPRSPAVIEVGSRQEGGQTVYYVKDNGVGFDMSYAHKLFGVFQRLHSAEEFEGTGVGLALVQRVIHRHNGHVWAEGRVNEGATFSFVLPDMKDEA